MANNTNLGRRWVQHWPSNGAGLWSCVGCVVATMVIGFAWGGWVTGGTATKMAADTAVEADAQLAAVDCIERFENDPDAIAQVAALQKAESFARRDLIQNGGWATMPGSKGPAEGGVLTCAQQFVKSTGRASAVVAPLAPMAIVPSPVIDPHAELFIGTGDGSNGSWRRP